MIRAAHFSANKAVLGVMTAHPAAMIRDAGPCRAPKYRPTPVRLPSRLDAAGAGKACVEGTAPRTPARSTAAACRSSTSTRRRAAARTDIAVLCRSWQIPVYDPGLGRRRGAGLAAARLVS